MKRRNVGTENGIITMDERAARNYCGRILERWKGLLDQRFGFEIVESINFLCTKCNDKPNFPPNSFSLHNMQRKSGFSTRSTTKSPFFSQNPRNNSRCKIFDLLNSSAVLSFDLLKIRPLYWDQSHPPGGASLPRTRCKLVYHLWQIFKTVR